MLTNAAHARSRLLWVIVIATLVLGAALWSGHPFVWLGWVAAERPKPTGPARVSVADLMVPLPLPGGTGTAPVPLLFWYPTPTPPNAPFVMYGPAWGGDRSDNVTLAAELASRGFVVAAYDDIARDPPELDASTEDAAVRKSQLEVDTDAGRARTLAVFDRRVALQAAKVVLLLDALERAPSVLPADVTISMQRVGMIGASFGGAAAAEVAQRDPRKRIGAAVNLDG